MLVKPNKRINKFKILYPNFAISHLGDLVHHKFSHSGTKKILRILQRGIYCKNLAKELRKTIAKCKVCQTTKFPNRSL